jgi:hypothetical protein
MKTSLYHKDVSFASLKSRFWLSTPQLLRCAGCTGWRTAPFLLTGCAARRPSAVTCHLYKQLIYESRPVNKS